MFGFEYSIKENSGFPNYNSKDIVDKKDIERIGLLVWQEHCVECAMPACYKTCVLYEPREDGRCKRFENGIERYDNKDSILDQNMKINMKKWAKLESIVFKNSYQYDKAEKYNRFLIRLANRSKKSGKFMKQVYYYIKEIYSRLIGLSSDKLPKYLLTELYNSNNQEFNLCIETKSDDEVLFRTSIQVKKGYNRLIVPTSSLNLNDSRNYIYLYPSSNEGCELNIISLYFVDFKKGTENKYVKNEDKKIKCVVWDLDNTIWDGIIGDDGIEGIKLKEDIVSIIKELDIKGILNTISSKNDEGIATEALKKFELYDYFVCPHINWDAKSNSINHIAKLLDIDLNTFAFIDDSLFELKEVESNCPSVRVCDVKDVHQFVNSSIFDVPVSSESKNRRQSYKEISIRNKEQEKYSNNFDQFLKDCNINIHIAKPKDNEFERCYELMQRSNQLNISLDRLTLEQIKQISFNENYDMFRIRVDDKYGDYGLVGLAIAEKKDSSIYLKHFVFSCRAARKRIETEFFKKLINTYHEKGYKDFYIDCVKTKKNKLMLQVFKESNLFNVVSDSSEHLKLHASLDKTTILDNIFSLSDD